MQLQRPVGLVTMQENRHRGDGDVSEYQGDDDVSPPWKIYQAGIHVDEYP